MKRLLLVGTCLILPTLALAQAVPVARATLAESPQMAIAPPPPQPMTDNRQLDEGIRALQNDWAIIKYQETNKEAQVVQMKKLAEKAAALSGQYPDYAEPKIWQAIITSTVAGLEGGLGALDLVKRSKSLLEQAIKRNPNALEGSAYTSLGSLYYKVPAWPLGFGDNGKAKAYLEQARAIHPTGIDPNYFYGDFLLETGHAKDAIPVLEQALKAAPRPGREVADTGRRAEINEALTKAREEAR